MVGWAPKDNKQVKTELLEQHLKETGGVIVTRFPPEPNVPDRRIFPVGYSLL